MPWGVWLRSYLSTPTIESRVRTECELILGAWRRRNHFATSLQRHGKVRSQPQGGNRMVRTSCADLTQRRRPYLGPASTVGVTLREAYMLRQHDSHRARVSGGRGYPDTTVLLAQERKQHQFGLGGHINRRLEVRLSLLPLPSVEYLYSATSYFHSPSSTRSLGRSFYLIPRIVCVAPSDALMFPSGPNLEMDCGWYGEVASERAEEGVVTWAR
ncbi:hypothetical protein PENSPDRAFT_137290 [Peniophora sp. CONT]|nr:hypothetical protein PENSPDRAFT_137290 [Peniophora sp. CONT]